MNDRTKRLADIDAWLDLPDEESEHRITDGAPGALSCVVRDYMPFLRSEIRDADAALTKLDIHDDGRTLAERVGALAEKEKMTPKDGAANRIAMLGLNPSDEQVEAARRGDVVFIYNPGGGPCHAVLKSVNGPWSNNRRGFCGKHPCEGPTPWCAEPDVVCHACAPFVEKTADGWRAKP